MDSAILSLVDPSPFNSSLGILFFWRWWRLRQLLGVGGNQRWGVHKVAWTLSLAWWISFIVSSSILGRLHLRRTWCLFLNRFLCKLLQPNRCIKLDNLLLLTIKENQVVSYHARLWSWGSKLLVEKFKFSGHISNVDFIWGKDFNTKFNKQSI